MERYNNLSTDVEIEILCRLPVKSLLRFKCVNKSWNTLIKSSTFALLHLAKSYSPDHLDDYLVCYDPKGYHREHRESDLVVSLLSNESMKPLVNFEIPEVKGEKFKAIIGMCDGLACLYYYTEPSFALINLATKEFKVIPNPPEINQPHHDFFSPPPSFVYDAKSNDYKLLIISELHYATPKKMSSYIFGVYSLYNDSWKQINDVHLLGSNPPNNSVFEAYMEGAYHLVTKTCDDEVIINSFNLHTETFGAMKGPYVQCVDLFDTPWKSIATAIVNGNLALINYDTDTDKSGPYTTKFDIWVMQEYGNEESWIKKFVVEPIYAEPGKIWKDSKILLQTTDREEYMDDREELATYDLKTGEFKTHKIYGNFYAMNCFEFVPSLFTLNRKVNS